MSTILLLTSSNVFTTFAWYGHLKYGHEWPLWKAILISWAIALVEYRLAAPANRLGFREFSGFQLKIIQEVVTPVVFIVFAVTFLKEKLATELPLSVRFSWHRRVFRLCVQGARTGCLNRRAGAGKDVYHTQNGPFRAIPEVCFPGISSL